MAVFRIERTRDYTVMSNHHLRNEKLSLKAKGLLSMMLSLPEDWNYTTRGLAKICKEGVDAIGSALRELETAGYIVRHQLRDKSGRISDTEYPVAVMCKFFGVSRSGYYAFVHRLDRPEKDAALAELIAQQRERSFHTYGYRRIWLWLKSRNIIRNPNKTEVAPLTLRHSV